MVAARAISSLSQAFMVLLVARLIDPALFGSLSALLGVGAFVSVVLDLGLANYVLRQKLRPSEHPQSRGIHFLTHLLGLAVGISTLVIAIVMFSADISIVQAILLSAWLATERIGEQQIAFIISDDRQDAASGLVLLRRVLPLILFAPLIITPVSPVTSYALALCTGGALGLVYGHFMLRRLPRGPSIRVLLRPTIRKSLPFWASSLSVQARELEPWLFLICYGPSQASLYAIAYRLGKPAQVLGAALAQIAIPRATRRSADYSRKALWAIGAIAVSGVLLGLCVTPLVPAFLEMVLGPEYLPATLIVQVTIVASGVVAMIQPLDGVALALGLERNVAILGWVAFTVAAVSILLSALAGLPTSMAGIALVSVYCLRNIFLWVYLRVAIRSRGTSHD